MAYGVSNGNVTDDVT